MTDSDSTHEQSTPSGSLKPGPYPEAGPESEVVPADVPAPPARRRWRTVVGLIVLLALLAAGGAWGYRYLKYAAAHPSTDDAYLTANISSIAAQVSGTITRVLVDDDQRVRPGDVLVTLDDTVYRAAVEQARSNLEQALAQAQAAGLTVGLTAATGRAQLTQAQGGVQQAEAGIGGAKADVQRTATGVSRSVAASKEAQANVQTAQAAVDAAQANQARAQAGLRSSQAQLAAAQAAVQAAETAVGATQADAEQKSRDAERYATLARDGAVATQQAELAATAGQVARAQADNARRQVDRARADVDARTADIEAARQQVRAAEAAVAQAASALTASRAHVEVAQADVDTAQAQTGVSRESVRQAQGRRTQAVGQLDQARTAPRQVAVTEQARRQAEARIAQLQAALADAQTRLSYTRIFAPVAGWVSAKTAEVGALVQPGTPLMALVQSGPPWALANYKETQLKHMRVGQRAWMTVDALGGERFTGHLESIAAATGATFALLPPENASGNFTRIVQRIPVKIVLEPRQRDLDRLLAGMSVHATVETR